MGKRCRSKSAGVRPIPYAVDAADGTSEGTPGWELPNVPAGRTATQGSCDYHCLLEEETGDSITAIYAEEECVDAKPPTD